MRVVYRQLEHLVVLANLRATVRSKLAGILWVKVSPVHIVGVSRITTVG